MPEFVTNFRYGLITYSQCGDLDPHAVVCHFANLEAECIIGRECHADGGIHLHVFADFGRKFRSRKADIFDVGGRHPNISASWGTPWSGYDYAIKDGDVVAGGLERPVERKSGGKAAVDWDTIIAAPTRDQFLDLCLQLAPKDTVCSWGSVTKFADWRYRVEPEEYVSPSGVGFTPESAEGLVEWYSQSGIGSGQTMIGELFLSGPPLSRASPTGAECHPAFAADMKLGRPRSLVLWGESRLGKTLWARSLGAHIYCVGLVSGAECMRAASVDYAIFDDIRGGIKFFPAFKEWLGCQRSVTVKQLYREPCLVDWGKPAIWLSNTDPREGLDPADARWLEANAFFVDLSTPIFHANIA